MIIDGSQVAGELEQELRDKVANLALQPRIVSILVGEDPASLLYSNLKAKAAERVGIMFEIVKIPFVDKVELANLVREVSGRSEVTGVMLQLPIPNIVGDELTQVISNIPLDKDVDGMRWRESGVMPATVRAVTTLLSKIESMTQIDLVNKRVVIVGARGAVGKPLVFYLNKLGYSQVVEVEWDTVNQLEIIQSAEVVISCTGKTGLIGQEMVQPGSIVIDVGAPRGDMMKEVYEKAGVAVPVPNGVGPVTIAMLMTNAVNLVVK